MRKIITLGLCMMMGMSLFAGCKKENETAISETPITEAPSSETAIDQFAMPESGDTVAEILIQGYGSIYVRFFEEAAPKTVENFITHAKEGYYDGLTFHRIIEDFMIQGGDPSGNGSGGESIWGGTFEDEFSSYLQPYRGALCMANSGPNTNGSQFFLVQAGTTYDAATLDQIEAQYKVKFDDIARTKYGEIGGTPWLYQMHTVFGQIYEGYEVLDAVAKVEKSAADESIPAEQVVIDKINIFEY